MTSPTGRFPSSPEIQEIRRRRRVDFEFALTVDYVLIEQRIMEAIREPVGTTIAPPVSGDSDEKA